MIRHRLGPVHIINVKGGGRRDAAPRCHDQGRLPFELITCPAGIQNVPLTVSRNE
jgi:hypothetical protein